MVHCRSDGMHYTFTHHFFASNVSRYLLIGRFGGHVVSSDLWVFVFFGTAEVSSLNIFITEFPSLLLRFNMTIDVCLKMVLIHNSPGTLTPPPPTSPYSAVSVFSVLLNGGNIVFCRGFYNY